MKDLLNLMNEGQRIMRRCCAIEKLRDDFMNANTEDEVIDVWTENILFILSNPETKVMYKNAMNRVMRVQEEKTMSWKLYLN